MSKAKINIIAVAFIALMGGIASYLAFQPSATGGATPTQTTQATDQIGVSVATSPNANQGTPAVRPDGESLAPGSDLATASPAAVTSALQAGFNNLLSGNVSAISFDSSTNATIARQFIQGHTSSFAPISIVPTLVSSTPQPDGSLQVDYTVSVTVDGGNWPTNFGTLTAALEPQGGISISHASLCALVKPLVSGACPF